MSSLTNEKVDEMNSADPAQLKKNNNKDELCGYIHLLRTRVEELESYLTITKRVQLLEKSHLKSLQYDRKENIEIHGLPEAITDTNLESSCIEILKDIGCGEINEWQIHACHRLKNRNITIMRFVNRKHADLALLNKKNLAKIDKSKYGLDKNIYINESMCRPMAFLAYKVRLAYKSGKVQSHNFWKGRLSLKIGNDIYYITHIDDLIDINLADEQDQLSFFKFDRE